MENIPEGAGAGTGPDTVKKSDGPGGGESNGQQPAAKRDVGMIWFGAMIGVLAAVSSQAGTTAALLGLLFTLAGGTFLAWFKPEALGPEDRPVMVSLLGKLGGGVILGVAAGFFVQFGREYWVMPAIYAKYKGLNLVDASGKPLVPDSVPKLFSTQAADAKSVLGDLADEQQNERLSEADKTTLKELSDSLRNLRGAADKYRRSGISDRLSDKARDSIDKVLGPGT